MEYIISIRINLPEEIIAVIKKEKQDFNAKYGGGYHSDPHITLYLSSYTKEGFSKLLKDLNLTSFHPFTISLLTPTLLQEGTRRKLFVVDISNKEQFYALHTKVLEVARQYRSPRYRDKDQERLDQGLYSDEEKKNLARCGYARSYALFEPHITIGEVPPDIDPQDLENICSRLKQIEGEQILIKAMVIYLHRKENTKTKAIMLEEVVVPFFG